MASGSPVCRATAPASRIPSYGRSACCCFTRINCPAQSRRRFAKRDKAVPMRILIVEESPQLQHLLGLALREAGHVVDRADDGAEGLHLAGTRGYAMIVLDVTLPKL